MALLFPEMALVGYDAPMEERERETKGERRERRRRNRRKMRVTGTSARLLLELARRRAEEAKRRGESLRVTVSYGKHRQS